MKLRALVVLVMVVVGLLGLGAGMANGQLLPSLWVKARVMRVVDGDTYDLLLNSQKVRVRLLNVDCPETTQPFGKQATDSVKRLLFIGRLVLVRTTGKDLYGRTLAHVRLMRGPVLGVTPPAVFLDSILASRGWAWIYSSPGNRLQGAADNAINNARGLWKCYYDSGPGHQAPVPPSVWRGLSKQNKAVYRGTCTW